MAIPRRDLVTRPSQSDRSLCFLPLQRPESENGSIHNRSHLHQGSDVGRFSLPVFSLAQRPDIPATIPYHEHGPLRCEEGA